MRELAEPFFNMSARAVRRSARPEGRRRTSATALLSVGEEIRPSGFVFHISRCGSTLIANALRAARDAIVISEPQPVSATVGSPALLSGAVRAYGKRRTGSERLLFFKLFSGNLFAIETYRRLWPEVPFLVVIRDPIEVMVSCLAKDPGWMRRRAWPEQAALRFGWPGEGADGMSTEEYCARGIAATLAAAEPAIGPLCRVVDYTRINRSTILAICEFFGAPASALDPALLTAAFASYSKDLQRSQAFVPDSDAKRAAASAEIRAAAERWAQPRYARLRARAAW